MVFTSGQIWRAFSGIVAHGQDSSALRNGRGHIDASSQETLRHQGLEHCHHPVPSTPPPLRQCVTTSLSEGQHTLAGMVRILACLEDNMVLLEQIPNVYPIYPLVK